MPIQVPRAGANFMKNSKSVYEIINERIFAEMERGIIPWHKPWKNFDQDGNFIPPQNFVSKKSYSGINYLMLLNAFDEPYFLTFNQIKNLGGKIIKGSKSFPITFWKPFTIEEKNSKGENVTKTKFFLRYYNVFNITQTEGIEYKSSIIEQLVTNKFKAIKKAEKIISGYKNKPVISIQKKSNKACYSPSLDKIKMPNKERFINENEFYSTLFHELSHSTGHKNRLSRKGITDSIFFGSHNYSKEELVAEFSASYLCSCAGIINKTVENSAAYIKHWFEVLKEDQRMLVHGTSQGQKACEYILNGTK